MIVTFYSYKGGTGRTMALANIAVLLAKAGRRVLMVDFDLEAPGIWRYFADYQRGLDQRDGLLELLTGEVADWRQCVTPIRIGAQPVSLLTSGRQDADYPARLLGFDWTAFFAERDGGEYFEKLRKAWQDEYDFVLIDSRTGVTDIGGVCTILLPDMIVPVFVANAQNVDGVVDVLRRAQQGRQDLAYDRPPALVLPVLSRFDSRTELESVNEWLTRAANSFGEFYVDWLPAEIEPRQILERTKLPYVAYFGFGEKLAVLLQGVSDPDSLGFALDSIATLIDSGMSDLSGVMPGRVSPSKAIETVTSAAPADDSWIAVVYSGDTAHGLAFAIDRQRLLTMNWVVQGRDDLSVGFPKIDEGTRYPVLRVTAPTVEGESQPAVIHLGKPVPSAVTPAPLGFVPAGQLAGNRWWAFGIPHDLGLTSWGTIAGSPERGLLQLDPDSRVGVQDGFAGAAVWSSTRGAVIGIVAGWWTGSVNEGTGIGLSLLRADADLPVEQLRALGDPVHAGLGPHQREQFVQQLARLAEDEVSARFVLEEIDFPEQRVPDYSAYTSARLFWERVLVELENGIVEGGVGRLVEVFVRLYPANRPLREIAASLRSV
ncbi:KGGVGR-motif variant AAA ATPase [Paractinoplanes durhamensis]|uniref:CobQ/CobB/MinD/ParA nucleotide binding domain-containing protein n=1 Tax=Paractinoplanes durhamensis TaxID=113563 RepID=A0ABQ3YX42_9ACTN|nr:effector-associated domain EAD1-containing protein [Actinoplanes durhamensis]GIE02079.1 hypothetical protein Adu01nite_34290 [Actinoplanes durhamensis]